MTYEIKKIFHIVPYMLPLTEYYAQHRNFMPESIFATLIFSKKNCSQYYFGYKNSILP
jgi:hypothetical protein